MNILQRSTIETYVIALLGFLAVVIPTWWVRLILVAAMVAIIFDLIIRSPWTADWSWNRKIFLGIVATLLLAGISWPPIREEYLAQRPATVEARLIYPEQPALQIYNPNAKTIRQIKYTVALWNLASSSKDPLAIPIADFDFIPSKQFSGPQAIFQSVTHALKTGDRLFGSMSVMCPDCQTGRTYWVYIVWGQHGWYSEIENIKSGQIMYPTNLATIDLTAFFQNEIEKIPASKRVEIKNPFR